MNTFKNILAGILVVALSLTGILAKAADRYYYQIKIYHLKNTVQEGRVDRFLQNAYIPAMHKLGIKDIGVFKPIDTDTADRKIYVFIPFKNMDELESAPAKLLNDAKYLEDGKDYLDAPYTNPPYARIETILLRAFAEAPVPVMPNLTANKVDRYYELRSYESPTEKYHASKVKMFTTGGETKIFKTINSNGVFYSQVIAGSHMPNLMYLTTYNSKQDRDDHWKVFSANPDWMKLKVMDEYLNNVSKNEQIFLHPTAYSDF